MILRFIVQAVACLTPNRRPSSTEEVPFFAVTTGWIAANQTVSGSLVEWRIVPAVSEVCFLQRLHWYNGRRVGKQCPRWPQPGRTKPSRRRSRASAFRHCFSVPNASRNAASLNLAPGMQP